MADLQRSRETIDRIDAELARLFEARMEAAADMLTPIPRRCPHLGCALRYNGAEHTWDCPCHGSRFAADGTLIDNPATGDIKRIKK